MNQELIESIKRETTRLEEEIWYCAKSHFNASDRWEKINLWIGLPTSILAATAGISAFKDQTELTITLSIALTILTTISTFLNPSQKASRHKNSGVAYNKLKNSIRLFREVELINTPLNEQDIKKRLLTYSELRNNLNGTSPNIPRHAYLKAHSDIIKYLKEKKDQMNN
ncbi:SLATT domain-containing protein [Enterobacteriaceae bacterium RIT691]|nr:SLATT domain-containing protein [Enterobacteriaceae bacterium RIT691]